MIFGFSNTIKKVCAAALAAFLLVPGAAQAQNVEWRGFAYLSDFSTECEENGWWGRPTMNVRYRVPNLGDNNNSSRLSFFDEFYAFGFYLDASRFNRSWQDVYAGSVGSAPYEWPEGTQIRVRRHIPAVGRLSATTQQVRLVGEIRNFDATEGCTVTFDATMLLRRQ